MRGSSHICIDTPPLGKRASDGPKPALTTLRARVKTVFEKTGGAVFEIPADSGFEWNRVNKSAWSNAFGHLYAYQDGLQPHACGRIVMVDPNSIDRTVLVAATFTDDNEFKKLAEGCYAGLRITCRTDRNGGKCPANSC
jgi:hypothetical protein